MNNTQRTHMYTIHVGTFLVHSNKVQKVQKYILELYHNDYYRQFLLVQLFFQTIYRLY